LCRYCPTGSVLWPSAVAKLGNLGRVCLEVDQEIIPPGGLKREFIIDGMLEDDLLVLEALEHIRLLQFLRGKEQETSATVVVFFLVSLDMRGEFSVCGDEDCFLAKAQFTTSGGPQCKRFGITPVPG